MTFFFVVLALSWLVQGSTCEDGDVDNDERRSSRATNRPRPVVTAARRQAVAAVAAAVAVAAGRGAGGLWPCREPCVASQLLCMTFVVCGWFRRPAMAASTPTRPLPWIPQRRALVATAGPSGSIAAAASWRPFLARWSPQRACCRVPWGVCVTVRKRHNYKNPSPPVLFACRGPSPWSGCRPGTTLASRPRRSPQPVPPSTAAGPTPRRHRDGNHTWSHPQLP